MRVFQIANPNIKFILSNNHVLGAVGPTLCPDTAPIGLATLQPGTLDIGSDPGADPYYRVGVFIKSIPIDFSLSASNLVDAAVSYTTTDLADTTILEIGTPTQALGIAKAGMAVSKSGRTTGVTSGTVEAVNVTSLVNYGGSCGTARFVKQISITPGTFSSGGDSGSVILDAATNTPVGLLFAGSTSSTIANHIYFVYKNLGVFVDGSSPAVSMQTLTSQFQKMEDAPVMKRLEAIQAKYEDKLFKIAEARGMGIGLAENGVDTAFILYIKKNLPRAIRNRIPQDLEGVPVRVIESDEFQAY
jgi:hypothetical protein